MFQLVSIILAGSLITTNSTMEVTKLKGRLPQILPPFMRSNIPGTWAYDTMSRRVITDILDRIVNDNSDELTRPTSHLRAECLLQLNDLKSSLEAGKLGYLRGMSDSGPDILEWDRILSTVSEYQQNWLDAPSFICIVEFVRLLVSLKQVMTCL